MTADVVGRVMLSVSANLVHGSVGAVMVDLHAEGSLSWRPIYHSKNGRKFAPKETQAAEPAKEG